MLDEFLQAVWQRNPNVFRSPRRRARAGAFLRLAIDSTELEQRLFLSASPLGCLVADMAPGNPPAVSKAPTAADVVLIDTHLAESNVLVQAVQPGSQVFLYDSTADSADAILGNVVNWAENSGEAIKSLSVLGHGAGGEFALGDQWISTANLSQTAGEWQQLGKVLATGASIDLFGCNVAAPGSDGQNLLNKLAGLTGAQVFASTDLTGQGGNWTLEAASAGAASELAQLQLPLNQQVLDTYAGTLAAIAVDNSTTPTNSGNITSLTWSHTIGSGSDGILIVDVSIHQDHHTETVASVTYGGKALTKIAGVANGSDDAEMWYLLAPTAGTANVVLTLNGNTEVVANATDYFGVDQTTPLGTPVTATATSSTPSITVAGTAGGLVLDSISALQEMAPMSPGAGQTQLWNTHSGGGGGGDAFGGGSYKNGAASVTMSWNVAHAKTWAMAGVALNAAQGDTPTVSAPASGTLNENSSLSFSSGAGNLISITDADAGSGTVQLTISASHGVVNLGSDTFGVTITGGGDGTSSVTIRGALDEINEALDGLTYTPATNYSGADSLAIAYNDLNANGNGVETANGSVALSVISATPVNAVPGPQATNADTALVFSSASGNQVSVADGVAATLQETLTATNGTLTLNGTTGLTFTTGTGTGDATMTFSGTIADINNALNGLSFQPANNYYGSANFQITSTDNVTAGGPYSATDSVAITVNPGVQPVVFVPPAQSANENATLVFSTGNGNSISVDDDNPSMPTVTLTATNGTLSLSQTTNLTFTAGTGTGDTTMTFSGALSDLNAALDGLTYTPNANYFGAATVQVTINDPASSPSSDSGTVNITVNHVNVAPVNTVPGSQTTNENGSIVFSSGGGNAVSVSDPAAGNNPLQITLSASHGTLSLNGTTGLTFLSGTGTGDTTMTFTGTIADINTALDGLIYQPANNYFGNDTLQLTSTDNTGVGGPQSAASSVAITVSHVDAVPVNTVPGPQAVNENSSLVFSSGSGNAISVSDPAAGNNPLQITLSVTNGTLSLNGTTGLTLLSGTGTGDTTVTFTGTITNVNNALNGLIYQPASNYFGADSLQLTSTDNTGSGGPQSAASSVAITVNHVNAAPVNTVPGPQTVNENGSLVFSSGGGNTVSVADPAAGSNPLQITLSAAHGTLSLSSTTGLTFSSGTGTGDTTMTFTGTITDINTALNGLTYRPANNYFGADSLQLTSTDNTGVGGPQSAASNVAITVNHVNAVPVNTVPGPQTVNENGSLVFSSGGGNAVSVSDPGAGNNPLQITLSVTNGTLSLNGTTGLTFLSGTGTGDTTVTFTGTITNVNNALNGLIYQPANNYFGADSLHVTSTDNTGSGGPQSAASSVGITVNHVNVAPVNTVPGPQTLNENSSLVFSSGGGNAISVSDPAAGNNPLQITLSVANGTLSLNGTIGLTFSTGTGTADTTMTFTGTITDINTALDGLTYQPTNDYFGADSLQLTSTDYTGLGGPQSAASSVGLTVNEVNQGPTITVPGSQAVDQYSRLTFSTALGNAIIVADADANGSVELVSLAATNGTIRLSQITGLTIVSGADGSSAVGIKGTLADLNAALDGLTFIPELNFHGSAGIGLSINDLGNTGLGGAKRSSAALGINVNQVTPIQPPPAINNPQPPVVLVPVGASPTQGSTSEGATLEQLAALVNRSLAVSHGAPSAVQQFPAGMTPQEIYVRPPSPLPAGALPASSETDFGARLIAPSTKAFDGNLRQSDAVDLGELWPQLDEVSRQLEGELSVESLTIDAFTGVSATLSAGYVVWLLRGGSLLASVLSSLPAWQTFDPLPVIDFWEKEKKEHRMRQAKGKQGDASTEEHDVQEATLETMIS